MKPIDEETILDKMEEMFGERMANYDQFPRLFNYQARLAIFELKQQKETNVSVRSQG